MPVGFMQSCFVGIPGHLMLSMWKTMWCPCGNHVVSSVEYYGGYPHGNHSSSVHMETKLVSTWKPSGVLAPGNCDMAFIHGVHSGKPQCGV